MDSDAARKHLEDFSSEESMARVGFLNHIFDHLNVNNLKLQGEQSTLADMWEEVQSFKLKLQLFLADLNNDMLHFPTLKSFDESYLLTIENLDEFSEFKKAPSFVDYNRRFKQFQKLKNILRLLETQSWEKLLMC